MTTQLTNNLTITENNCQVTCHDGKYHGYAVVHFEFSVSADTSELDEIVNVSKSVGQFQSRKIASQTLDVADRRIAATHQLTNPNLRRHGQRPYRIVSSFGTIEFHRQRLFDTKTGKTYIPSAILWHTARHHHYTPELKEYACEVVQNLSYRKSRETLSYQAGVESLLAASTIHRLKQEERKMLESAQQQFVNNVIQEHGDVLREYAFLPDSSATTDTPVPPTPPEHSETTFSPPLTDSTTTSDENDVLKLAEIQEEAKELFQFFTSESLSVDVETPAEYSAQENTIARSKCQKVSDQQEVSTASVSRQPRQVPDDVILLQVDEVVTKSQETGQKINKTYTATIEQSEGRCLYMVASSSTMLQSLVAVILYLLGLFRGKRLEVISDGASWIANWIGRLKWSRIAHILCWYHLCKRVTEGLSGLGVPKEERQIWQKKILGHLWKGETAKAIEILNGLILHCRVPSRLKELVEDLKRKESWIVNYQLRHEQRLWIASTKVEKWNDNAVSARCKKNGMAWKEKGVFAIAIKNAKKFIKYCKNKDNILHTKS